MKPLRFAWVGFHAEGGPAFEALMQAGAPIHGVITLTPELRARRSGAIDYGPLCARFGVPLYEIADINGPDGLAALGAIQPDVAFVIGWSQIARPPALRLARIGMIGAHASHLPRYRGSAPVNWALIKGETETGNSLIWLAEGVDRGAVIDQTAFGIRPYDTVASLYDRVAASNCDMLLRLLPRLLAGQAPREPRGPRLHSRARASLPWGVRLRRRHRLDRVAGRAPLERQRHHRSRRARNGAGSARESRHGGVRADGRLRRGGGRRQGRGRATRARAGRRHDPAGPRPERSAVDRPAVDQCR